MFRSMLIAAITLGLFSGIVQAETPAILEAESLSDYSRAIEVVEDLQARGVLSDEAAAEQRSYYTARATELAGRELSAENADTWFALDGWTILIGFCVLLGSIGVVIAAGLLFGHYILALLAAVPVVMWELAFYGTAAGCMFFSGATWIVVVGAVIFAGALAFTNAMHGEKTWPLSIYSLICTVVWAGAAIYQQSQVVGFLAILSFEAFLGFSVLVGPLCVLIGFKDEDKMAQATFASLLLLLGGVVLSSPTLIDFSGESVGMTVAGLTAPFTFGMLSIGTFVYFLGLLILGSYWYPGKNKLRFTMMQVFMLLSGGLALYFGTTLGLGWLYGVGGTFFVLWICEKYAEFCVESKVGWQWALLFGAGGLLGAAYLMSQYPEVFLWTNF